MVQSLQNIVIAILLLVTGAAADCWSGKCSRLGLASTVSCASACRAKGYSISGYEVYTRYVVDVWVGK